MRIGAFKPFSYFCIRNKTKIMNTKKPLILISNDDGYHAKGINSLIGMLRDIATSSYALPNRLDRASPRRSLPQFRYASSCAATSGYADVVVQRHTGRLREDCAAGAIR